MQPIGTIQSRIAQVISYFTPLAIDPKRPLLDESELMSQLGEREIMVLPMTRSTTHQVVDLGSDKKGCMVQVDVFFQFMDTLDSSTLTMQNPGVAYDKNTTLLSNTLLTDARRNALLTLFYKGLPTLEEVPTLPTLVEQVEAVHSTV